MIHTLLEYFQQVAELRICSFIDSMHDRFRRKITHFVRSCAHEPSTSALNEPYYWIWDTIVMLVDVM